MSLAEGTHIEIHGDEVCIVRTQVQRRVKTQEFIGKMGELNPVCSGLQPQDCIYYQQWMVNNVPHKLYVIEWEPRRVSLNYQTGWESLRNQVFEVWFPFVQWYLKVISNKVMRVHISCTPHRIKQMDDPLFRVPLPNNDSGGFCQGTVGAKPNLPVAQQCEQMITDLVASIWNNDLQPPWADFGLHDRELENEASEEYSKARRKWRAEKEQAYIKWSDETDEDRKLELKAKLDDIQDQWLELEKPLAEKYMACCGIPMWARRTKEEGPDVWQQLVKVPHYSGDFDKFVKHLAGQGGG